MREKDEKVPRKSLKNSGLSVTEFWGNLGIPGQNLGQNLGQPKNLSIRETREAGGKVNPAVGGIEIGRHIKTQ